MKEKQEVQNQIIYLSLNMLYNNRGQYKCLNYNGSPSFILKNNLTCFFVQFNCVAMINNVFVLLTYIYLIIL